MTSFLRTFLQREMDIPNAEHPNGNSIIHNGGIVFIVSLGFHILSMILSPVILIPCGNTVFVNASVWHLLIIPSLSSLNNLSSQLLHIARNICKNLTYPKLAEKTTSFAIKSAVIDDFSSRGVNITRDEKYCLFLSDDQTPSTSSECCSSNGVKRFWQFHSLVQPPEFWTPPLVFSSDETWTQQSRFV